MVLWCDNYCFLHHLFVNWGGVLNKKKVVMLKDERRFDFIPQKKWKSLSKEDMSHLQSYKSYYGHYKRTLKKMDELGEEE